MGTRALFRVLLFVGIVANIGVIFLLASEKPDTSLVDSWEQYDSEDLGISVKYPEGWRVNEFNRADIEYEVRFLANNRAFVSVVSSLSGGLMMDVLQAKPPTITQKDRRPLLLLHQTCMEVLAERIHNSVISEPAAMKVSGGDAYCSSYEYRSWDGLMGRGMKGMIVSTWNGENHITLQLLCPAKEYDRMFAVFGTFTQSYVSRNRSD